MAKPDVPRPEPGGVVSLLAGAGKGDKSLNIARLMGCLFAIRSSFLDMKELGTSRGTGGQ